MTATNTKPMDNQPILFNRIINGNSGPWLEANRHEEKFEAIISDLKPTEPDFGPIYEIEFYPFFNNKTRYYHKLITNEANRYCNQIIELIRSEDDIRIIKYLLNDLLKKKLRSLLKDVGKLIRINDYDLKYIDPYQSAFFAGVDHKSDTYVIQFLKTALVKVYLEIQEVFKSRLEDDYPEMKDLYLQALSEPIPEHTFLKKTVEAAFAAGSKPDLPSCSPVKEDLCLHSFTYRQFIKKGDLLIDLCDSLKKNLFIDKKTSVGNFRRIFSGKEISSPVRWTGHASDFYYFIYLIYTKYKVVEDLRQNQWKVACRCFVQGDGTPFERDKIKNLKRPRLTGGLLEKAVELINKFNEYPFTFLIEISLVKCCHL